MVDLVRNRGRVADSEPGRARTLRDAANNQNIGLSNFTSGMYGYGGSSLLGLSNLAEVAGADNLARGLRSRSEDMLGTASQYATDHGQLENVRDLGSFWDAAKANANQGLGSMLPIIAAAPFGAAAGLAAATTPMYGENIGVLEEDESLQGLSAGQRSLYAAPTAALQGALNYAVPGGLVGRQARNLAERTGTGALGKAGVTVGANMAVEGATEAGEEALRQQMHSVANPERDTSGDRGELLQAGFAGTFGGGPIGAAQAAGGYVSDRVNASSSDSLQGRGVGQRVADTIADAGTEAGLRAGEREGQARGEAALAELERILTTPAQIDPAAPQQNAAEALAADDAAKREAADQWADEVLNDPAESPAKQEAAREYQARRDAGADNAQELAGASVAAVSRMRESAVARMSDIITKLTGEGPAPRNRNDRRGSAMEPVEPMRRDDLEAIAFATYQAAEPGSELRTLRRHEVEALVPHIQRFAEGEGGPEARQALDALTGSPEATERVLESYREGLSEGVATLDVDNEVVNYSDDTGSDAAGLDPAITDNDAAFASGVSEIVGETQNVRYNVTGGVRQGENGERRYYDTRDQTQSTQMDRAREALGRDTEGATSVDVREVGLIEREIEARGFQDNPVAREQLELEITNEVARAAGRPELEYVPDTLSNDDAGAPARGAHRRNRQQFVRELSRRVRLVNNRYKALRAESTAMEAGALDFSPQDVKDVTVNYGRQAHTNPKASAENGTLAFERENSDSPLLTTAPMLVAHMMKRGRAAKDTTNNTETRSEEAFRLMADGITGLSQAEGYTGRFGYVDGGDVIWMDGPNAELPLNFKVRGDITFGEASRNSQQYRDFESARNIGPAFGMLRALSKMVDPRVQELLSEIFPRKASRQARAKALRRLRDLGVQDRIRALHREHIGGEFSLGERVERHDIVPSEDTNFTDDAGNPIDRGLLAYGNVGSGPEAIIRRDDTGRQVGVTGDTGVSGTDRAVRRAPAKKRPQPTRATPERFEGVDDAFNWAVDGVKRGVPNVMRAMRSMNKTQLTALVQAMNRVADLSKSEIRTNELSATQVRNAKTLAQHAKVLIAEQAPTKAKPAKPAKATQPKAKPAKANKQSAQRPEPTIDKNLTEQMKKAATEVRRLLGDDFKVNMAKELLGPDGEQWSGSWEADLIRIAAGAQDKMGIARHEAMHQMMHWLRTHGGTDTVAIIENFATNKVVNNQLKKLLAEHPGALKQLSDPEEAAAYAFQFWTADALNVGPKAQTLFQKITNFLDNLQLALREHLFRSQSAADARQDKKRDKLAVDIMDGLAAGALANAESRAVVIEALENNAKAVGRRRARSKILTGKVKNFAERAIFTNASVFEDSVNPAVKSIGQKLFRMEGDNRGDQQNFLEAFQQENDRVQVKIRNLFRGVDKETLELATEYLNSRRDINTIHHPEAKEVVRKAREILNDLLQYQRDNGTQRWDERRREWVNMGEVKESYWPRVWDISQLAARQNAFLDKMVPALEEAQRKGAFNIPEGVTVNDAAKAILNKLINGMGVETPFNDSEQIMETSDNLGITPFHMSVNRRELNFLKDEDFAEFFSKDAVNTMTNYATQAIKRAEYVKRFGNGGVEMKNAMTEAIIFEMGGEKLVEDAKKKFEKDIRSWQQRRSQVTEGGGSFDESAPTLLTSAREIVGGKADELQTKAVKDLESVAMAIQAIEGTLGHDIDPRLRQVFAATTTYQNFRLLPTALFASMNDMVGIVMRGGSVRDSYNGLVRGVREIGLRWKDEYSQDELSELAEQIGIVGAGSYMSAIGQTYSSQYMHGKLRSWNDKLFKWNGLEAWNRAMRIQATGSAINFIKQHIEKPNQHSKRYLDELFGEGYDTSLVMKDGDLDYSNDKVREALLTWVNGAVIRPNAAHRPIHASDPHYLLFYHLKQFAYSFHKVILRRAWVEFKHGNYLPATALFAGYVPVSVTADMVKEMLLLGADDPWWAKQGGIGLMQRGVERAQLGGIPQLWLGDTVSDPLKMFANTAGWASNLSNVAGPAPDQLLDLMTVPVFENKELGREIVGGVPGGVILRRYID